jgi:hypothetical protein
MCTEDWMHPEVYACLESNQLPVLYSILVGYYTREKLLDFLNKFNTTEIISNE